MILVMSVYKINTYSQKYMGISSSSRSISYNAEKIVLPGALKTSLKNFHVP